MGKKQEKILSYKELKERKPELWLGEVNNENIVLPPNFKSAFENGEYSLVQIKPGSRMCRVGNNRFSSVFGRKVPTVTRTRKNKVKYLNYNKAVKIGSYGDTINGALEDSNYVSLSKRKYLQQSYLNADQGIDGPWWMDKKQFENLKFEAIKHGEHAHDVIRDALAICYDWSNMDVIWECEVIKTIYAFKGIISKQPFISSKKKKGHMKRTHEGRSKKKLPTLRGGYVQYFVPHIVFDLDSPVRNMQKLNTWNLETSWWQS